MIQFVDVAKQMNGRVVLKDVSFKINPNETVLLVGSSGAGKTTILKLILGLIFPTSGSIYVFGKDIAGITEDELNTIRQKFGLVFQDGALFDSLTVEQNVGFFLRETLKVPEQEVHRRVKDILRKLQLAEFLDYFPGELSGGMVKRVAIARAIAADPQVLLYDEPTAGLDPFSAKQAVSLIGRLQRDFKHTSLIVTHEIHHFVGLGDRLLMLKDGSITYDGEVDLSIFDLLEEDAPSDRQTNGERNGSIK